MTRIEEQALLRELLAICARLHIGFKDTVDLIAQAALLPVTIDTVDKLGVRDETYVLAFLKRFEQFEDVLNRTLKLIARVMEHGRIERLTAMDVTRRAYALGIIDSEDQWADAVRARNTLAHEYPLDAARRAKQINAAWDARETLNATWSSIDRFVASEGLLA